MEAIVNGNVNISFDGSEEGLWKEIEKAKCSISNSLEISFSDGGSISVPVQEKKSRAGEMYTEIAQFGATNSADLTKSDIGLCEMRIADSKTGKARKVYFEPDGDVFWIRSGSVDTPKPECRRGMFPVDRWLYWPTRLLYKEKGYKDLTRITKAGEAGIVSKQAAVRKDDDNTRLYEELMGYAHRMVKKVGISNPQAITKEMVEYAEKELAWLQKSKTLATFNKHFEAFQMVGGARRSLKKDRQVVQTISDLKEAPAAVRFAGDVVMAMKACIGMTATPEESFRKWDIHVWKANDKQRKFVMDKINPSLKNKVVEIYRIKHYPHIKRMEEFKKKEHIYGSGNGNDDLGIQHYFHGSDNSNWLPIIENGIITNSNAAHGRMFGELGRASGYYAPSFDKAWGYCSTSTRWNSGKGSVGFIGMYACAMGRPLYVTSSGRYDTAYVKQRGKNSIYARARDTGLRADEVVAPMSCIEYLIKVRL